MALKNMVTKIKPGDRAYIVETGRQIREVTVFNVSGDFYTLRFSDTGGAIKLRENRVFPSKEAAEASFTPRLLHRH